VTARLRRYDSRLPPVTPRISPVTKRESAEARKTYAGASSAGNLAALAAGLKDGDNYVRKGTIAAFVDPVNGIGPKDIRIEELLKRLENETIREVILATNPGFEGDYTASTIKRDIQNELVLPELKVTTLARGLPLGSDLEYADEGTLSRALEGRREL